MKKIAARNGAKTIAMKTTKPSQDKFLQTLKVEKGLYTETNFDNPNFWNSENAYLGAMGADASAATVDKPWYEKLVDVYGAVQAQRTAQKYQDQMMQENMARAKAGKAQLDMESFMQNAAPRVNVGITDSTKNMLMYGGLALAGLLTVFMILPRRKR